MIDQAEYRQVLGHYPTGVAAITSVDADGTPLALLVGSFTSVSLDPPLVGFLPDRKSASWPQIEATGRFAVNILAADQGGEARVLAGKTDKFVGVAWHPSPHGLPMLDKALATIECRLHQVIDAGDHLFVIGMVENLAAHHEGDPMLFWRGRYGGFAG